MASRVGGDADHNGYPDIVLVADEGSGYTYQNHARFYRNRRRRQSADQAGLSARR